MHRREAIQQLTSLVTAAFVAPAESLVNPERSARQGRRAYSEPRRAYSQSAPADRPNVLFILMDDMRWDLMGCAGHPIVRTPHLDRLAREGAIFRNAFVCISLCSPSRASFLTGVYPQIHGVVDNRTPLDFGRSLPFPKAFQQAGYRTGMFGKWHMGVDDEPKPGFDRWASFRGQGTYNNPIINVDGERRPYEGFTDDVTTGLLCDFIRAERDRPFAAILGFKSCHSPFEPPLRTASLYNQPTFPRPATFDTAGPDKPAWVRHWDDAGHTPWSRLMFDDLMRRFLRLVSSADDNVGRVLAVLDETGLAARTMVVFSSDNGFLVHEHGLYDKRAMYEESIRIPLIVRYPAAVPARQEITALTLNIDLAPTLLDLAGLEGRDRMQGLSVLPNLKGAPAPPRSMFFYQYDRETPFMTPSMVGVRDERWKLVRYREDGQSHELYDLETDPHETRNRFDDAAARGERDRLDKEILRLEPMIRVSSPIRS